jgi:hypothetical protein
MKRRERLRIPVPYSAGVFLTYRCTGACKHCLYACSPRWSPDWLSLEDAERILAGLAWAMRGKYPFRGGVGVNEGLHFTGGEPFLNFELLLSLVELARRLEIPSLFVETNAFWAVNEEVARKKLQALKEAGLDGILISVNPFLLEHVPFSRTQRAVRIASDVFGTGRVLVYQRIFYEELSRLGVEGTLPWEEYLRLGGLGFRYMELLPGGRVPYKLGHLFVRRPAQDFFGSSCRGELIRDWHVHVDNYGNFVPGFCAGLTLGDARELERLCREGVDLAERPVLRALLSDLAELYELGRRYGYEERAGYVSKCHLCLDIRRHLARTGELPELAPRPFYEHLED